MDARPVNGGPWTRPAQVAHAAPRRERLVDPARPGWSIHLTDTMWNELAEHLFCDGDEHGVVVLAGYSDGPRGPRLLGRELLIARDGVDYVPGRYGYRALTATFVGDAAERAHAERLAYLAVHNHGGRDSVAFSRTDLASHERGYPTLVQLTGQLVGGLVLTPDAAAGDLWLPDGGREQLAELVIPGTVLRRLHPEPALTRRRARTDTAPSPYDRQARMLGDRGQDLLHGLRVGVVGLGGVGSIVVETLARLGVGALDLVDPDLVDTTNLTRLVGAQPDDVGRPKTDVAAHSARRAQPDIKLRLHATDVGDPDARASLANCDWIVLAADTDAARHWVNEIIHRHLVPALQAGVKIPVAEDGIVGDIHAASRFLRPGRGCLHCNGLINPTQLAIDLQPEAVREIARYIPEVAAPSVISLNMLAAADAVNTFLLASVGLLSSGAETDLDHPDAVLHRPRTRTTEEFSHRQAPECLICTSHGALARGRRYTSVE